MASISVYTVYAENEYLYASLMKNSMEMFKSGNNDITYYCIHSCGKASTVKGMKVVGHTPNVNNAKHGSLNHAVGLNLIQPMAKSDYAIIVDSDIAITYKGWDEVVTKFLDEGNDCFGFDFGSRGPRYRNFPGVFFFSWKPEGMKSVRFDWNPKLEKNGSPIRLTVDDPEEARMMNMKPGESIKCDTGWKIPLILGRAGMDGYALKRVIGNSKHHLLPFESEKQRKFCLTKKEHMAEWHYDGKLFGTHKQASRSHHLTKSDWGRTWHSRINAYLKKEHGFTIDA